jgi:quercetin dioxygenase-like cupin family protein
MSIHGCSIHAGMLIIATILLAVPAGVLAADAAAGSTPPVELHYSPPSHMTILGTTFVDWDSLVPRYTPVGLSRAVFDNPTPTLEKFELHITTLRPGMLSHAVHHHPWEEIIIIKEGEVEANINGHTQRAGPGALVFYASHDPHNMKNIGTTDATYYVINFYTDLVHTVPDKPAIEQAVAGTMGSSVIDCNRLPSTPNATGSRVAVCDSPTLTFLNLSSHITTLNVGQSTRTDMVDAGDELFIVRSGELEARVNDVTCRLKEGSLFYIAPNDKRTFKNIGPAPASYLVIKVTSAKTPKAGQK